jgi:hypothetical protein
MADYRIQETGAVVTEHEFRGLHPTTSFPSVITEEMANDFGADVVFEGPQATSPDRYHYSQRDGVEEIEGKWYTKYILGPVFADYTDEEGVVHTAAEQEAAHHARIDAEVIASNKATRNQKLSATDWTQLGDVPLTAECKTAFADYRQALRDADMLEPVWPEVPAEEWA